MNRMKTMGKIGTMSMKTKKQKQSKCIICNKAYNRLDVHLQKTHKLRRHTQMYKKTMEACISAPNENVIIETASGSNTLNTVDRLKSFANGFNEYLEMYTPLCEVTRVKEVRNVREIISSCLGEIPVDSLEGHTICRILRNSTKSSPPGYFKEREGVASYSYMRKILKGCQRAVIYMHESQGVFTINLNTREKTLKCLKSLSGKCFFPN